MLLLPRDGLNLKTYPSRLHYRDCCELVIIEEDGYSLFAPGVSRKHGMLSLLHRLNRVPIRDE